MLPGGTRISISLSCAPYIMAARSEEHTSELQSRENLVCRLLLEKKKQMDVWLTSLAVGGVLAGATYFDAMARFREGVVVEDIGERAADVHVGRSSADAYRV